MSVYHVCVCVVCVWCVCVCVCVVLRLKEEWVRELVKSNMMAKQLNQMYITQIQTLEQVAVYIAYAHCAR